MCLINNSREPVQLLVTAFGGSSTFFNELILASRSDSCKLTVVFLALT